MVKLPGNNIKVSIEGDTHIRLEHNENIIWLTSSDMERLKPTIDKFLNDEKDEVFLKEYIGNSKYLKWIK